MTGTIGLLCSRVRVEEKGIIAALAKAGIPACPVPPTAPLRAGTVPACGAVDPAADTANTSANAAPVAVLIDRNQDRLVAAATLPLLQLGTLPILTAGVAAISTRARIAAVLQAAGLPRPETVVACSVEAALAAFDQLGGAATLLPLTTGEPAVTLWDRDSAEAVLEHRCVLGGAETKIALLQAGTPTAAERAMIIVVGGEAVGIETASDAAAFADPAALSLADLTAQTLGADLVGVEIAQTDQGWVVWDINPAPEFRSAQPLGTTTVADAIAALAINALQPEPSLADLVSMDRPATHADQHGGQLHVYAAAF